MPLLYLVPIYMTFGEVSGNNAAIPQLNPLT